VIVSLLLLVGLGVVAVVAVRRMTARGGGPATEGHAVRRLFQYLLLYGLLIVVATGLSGLLGRLLSAPLATADQSELARSVAFTVVGVPLFVLVALWSRRRLAEDPLEAASPAWALYITAASLTSLVVAMLALHDVLSWAAGLQVYSGRSLARLIVWGSVWGLHWWVQTRAVPADRYRVHHVVGSLIGLVTAATGLAGLLAGTVQEVLGVSADALLAGGDNRLLRGAVTLAVGAPVWFVYWVRTTAGSERDPLWLGYVLLAGVGGGLVTAIAAASTVLYDILVWFLGDPRAPVAARHFADSPSAAAAAATGVLVWWYHQAVLGAPDHRDRTELRRVYEYLMAGIGLLAAAGGLTMVIVAAVEALTAPALVGGAAINSLLAAATLLAVGTPVWWFFWSRIQAAATSAPEQEHASPTRRIYLFVLFGLGGVAAVIALLTGVYLLFEDIFEGTFGAATMRSMRFPIGVLATTGAIAGYHWSVYRGEREQPPAARSGPRFILLVGRPDPDITSALASATGARVEAWPRADAAGAPWVVDDVVSLVGTSTDGEIIVLSDDTGPHVIPVRRG
jgi:uncharacterized protein DUF5671